MFIPNILFSLIFLTIISVTKGTLKLEKIADPVLLGEGPHWDSQKQILYFVDILNQTVLKYDPQSNEVTRVFIEGGPVSLVIPDRHNEQKFIISRGLDIVSMEWDGKSPRPSSLTVLASVDADKPGNRFNDGKADSSGRLWAGTMGPENTEVLPEKGSLYSFDLLDNFKPKKKFSPVSLSNGIAWNEKNDLMYFIDTLTRKITVFDFDLNDGKLGAPREYFSLEKNNITGYPDGMTIDRNDDLWVAVYKGRCILHIDGKDGKLLKKIYFPVSQITSCTFGGKNLQDLYVTTSRKDLSEADLRNEPLAGSLFKVTGLDVQGQIKSNQITTGF